MRSSARHDRAVINCEYSMATFSTGERKKNRKGDRYVIKPFKSIFYRHLILTQFPLFRRSTEISLIIKQTFESAIFTNLYPNTQIDIYIQVIQADGGSFSFSVIFSL